MTYTHFAYIFAYVLSNVNNVMKIENKFIRYPENLEIKAQLTIHRIDVSDMAARIGKSRIWLGQVLNGHKEGKDIIELVKKELQKELS